MRMLDFTDSPKIQWLKTMICYFLYRSAGLSWLVLLPTWYRLGSHVWLAIFSWDLNWNCSAVGGFISVSGTSAGVPEQLGAGQASLHIGLSFLVVQPELLYTGAWSQVEAARSLKTEAQKWQPRPVHKAGPDSEGGKQVPSLGGREDCLLSFFVDSQPKTLN